MYIFWRRHVPKIHTPLALLGFKCLVPALKRLLTGSAQPIGLEGVIKKGGHALCV